LLVHPDVGQPAPGSSWLHVSSGEAKRGDLPFGKSPDDRHLVVFVLGFGQVLSGCFYRLEGCGDGHIEVSKRRRPQTEAAHPARPRILRWLGWDR
jgi:hypothetical protein